MTNDHAQIACAQRTCRFHKLAFPRGQDLRTHQARVPYPASEGEGEHEVEDAGAAEGHESNRQQNSGERKKSVHDDDIDEAVEASAIVAGQRSHDETYRERNRDHATAHQHGNPRTINETREDVAAQFIRAAPVRGGWTRQACGQVDVGGILGRDPGSEQGKDYQDENQHDTDCR